MGKPEPTEFYMQRNEDTDTKTLITATVKQS